VHAIQVDVPYDHALPATAAIAVQLAFTVRHALHYVLPVLGTYPAAQAPQVIAVPAALAPYNVHYEI